jgi:DNA-binding CsgD family transcriptional regulator
MQPVMLVEPWPGVLFLAAVVVLTMNAAESFDPRLVSRSPPPGSADPAWAWPSYAPPVPGDAGGHGPPHAVFVTGYADVRMGVEAMKAGAVDLLTKPVDDRALIAAIRRAVTRDRHDRAIEARRAAIQRRVSGLTPRELGMRNRQIAAALGIAEKTVKVHRGRVMEKMRAGSVAELVRLADEAGVTVPKALVATP